MIWAWQHPDDLRFVDSGKTGIAYLSATVVLGKLGLKTTPRFQPLYFPPNSYKMAVIRIETNKRERPDLSQRQRDILKNEILRLLSSQPANALQIDFDAAEDEREFYRLLLLQLRKRMPSRMALSMTSLASWCLADTWVKDMPCDEVVPMFFSMGESRADAVARLSSQGLAAMPMQESIGVSIDEQDVLPRIKSLPAHIYLFSSGGWNSARAVRWVKSLEERVSCSPAGKIQNFN